MNFLFFTLFEVVEFRTMNEENEVLFKKETKSLVGKIFIVTGANRGFGYAITETLVERHATVVMACRDSEKAYEAIAKIRLKTASGNLVNFPHFIHFVCSQHYVSFVSQNFVPLDLTSFDSIVNFATIIKQTYPGTVQLFSNSLVIPVFFALTI